MAPCIDLFASYKHHQLPRYYSAYEEDYEALGHKAFAYFWDPGICLYLNELDANWTGVRKDC